MSLVLKNVPFYNCWYRYLPFISNVLSRLFKNWYSGSNTETSSGRRGLKGGPGDAKLTISIYVVIFLLILKEVFDVSGFFRLVFVVPVPVYFRIDIFTDFTDPAAPVYVVVISVVDTFPLAWTSFMEA